MARSGERRRRKKIARKKVVSNAHLNPLFSAVENSNLTIKMLSSSLGDISNKFRVKVKKKSWFNRIQDPKLKCPKFEIGGWVMKFWPFAGIFWIGSPKADDCSYGQFGYRISESIEILSRPVQIASPKSNQNPQRVARSTLNFAQFREREKILISNQTFFQVQIT